MRQVGGTMRLESQLLPASGFRPSVMKHLAIVLVLLTPGFAQQTPRASHEQWVLNPKDYQVPLVYRQELEANLLWMIDREQRGVHNRNRSQPVVGVYADAGTWHLGAKSLVYALEREGIACRVLDHDALGMSDVERLKAIVVPGGYALYMKAGVGEPGMAAIRRLVNDGGVYLGICAGGFLAAKTLRWESESFPYPLELFDGVAEGSIPQIAKWPASASVAMTVVDDCPRFRLLGKQAIYYQGGGRFVGGTNVNVIATYPDKTAAVIERKVGSGRVVLSGGHFERPTPETDPGAMKPPPEFAGKVYNDLMGLQGDPGKARQQPWKPREFRSSFTAATKLKTMLARETELRRKLNALKKSMK